MILNMDLNKTVVIKTADQEWEGSPSEGVWRKPLVREAAEHGHTTSIVRFDPGCIFPEHSHPLGEEVFVLDGVFSDQYGDYPAGTYLRNPPGSKHVPFSQQGCTLFVKLEQFDSDDSEVVRVNTKAAQWLPGQGKLQVMPLHEFENESVALVRWPSNSKFVPHMHFGGEEIYVLSGTFIDEYGSYPQGSWIRSPHKSEHCPFVEEETVIWVKTGHLPTN
jgi:anti-sigma factor ChrR (cupin superfamily)